MAKRKVIDRRIEEFREVNREDVDTIIGGINWSINAELCSEGSVSNLTSGVHRHERDYIEIQHLSGNRLDVDRSDWEASTVTRMAQKVHFI
jgi:hypothetical protein